MNRRVLVTTGALAGACVVGLITSAPASADFQSTDHLSCGSTTNYAQYWFNCSTDYTSGTTWWVNGTHNSSLDGQSAVSIFCNKWHQYTIGVDLGTAAAETVSVSCEEPF